MNYMLKNKIKKKPDTSYYGREALFRIGHSHASSIQAPVIMAHIDSWVEISREFSKDFTRQEQLGNPHTLIQLLILGLFSSFRYKSKICGF